MKIITTATAAALTLALAACGGNGDDALGDRAADHADNQADALEANGMDDLADNVEEMGERREDAIDDADVNAAAMTPAQQNALVNGAMPVEAAPKN